jgi:hypothetical protein
MQNSIDQLTTTIAGVVAGNQSNKRFTPTVFVAAGIVRCEVANVTGDTETVVASLLTLTGAVQTTSTLTLGPGVSSRTDSESAPGFSRCQFTVTTGSRTAIRAALVVNAGAGGTDVLVVPAE